MTTQEKQDLECFFNHLLFDNYGAFVLFGSKPICEMSFRDPESSAFQRWYDSLSDEKIKELQALLDKKKSVQLDEELNFYPGWLAWEKVRKTFDMKYYIMRIDDLNGIGHYELRLINIEKTALVMAENYAIFKNASGMEFHPLEAVFDCQNLDSIYWKNIFSLQNHIAKGLLFGFGLRNSLFGDWYFTYTNNKASSELSTSIVEYLKAVPYKKSTTPVKSGEGSASNFTIPLFGVVEGDDTVEKYKKEKALIEKIYYGQDLVETTLRRLAS